MFAYQNGAKFYYAARWFCGKLRVLAEQVSHSVNYIFYIFISHTGEEGKRYSLIIHLTCVRKILTIDTHNDTALRINNPNSKPGGANPQVSFQKMKDGGLDAAFFAIYVGQESRDSAGLAKATAFADDQLRKFKSYTENFINSG